MYEHTGSQKRPCVFKNTNYFKIWVSFRHRLLTVECDYTESESTHLVNGQLSGWGVWRVWHEFLGVGEQVVDNKHVLVAGGRVIFEGVFE